MMLRIQQIIPLIGANISGRPCIRMRRDLETAGKGLRRETLTLRFPSDLIDHSIEVYLTASDPAVGKRPSHGAGILRLRATEGEARARSSPVSVSAGVCP